MQASRGSMEVSTSGSWGVAPQTTFTPHHTPARVLCCLCGTLIPPNPSNMCVNCLRSQVDITAGIQKQVTVLWCKECGRYLQPPRSWQPAQLESRELLTYCIKRIKGLAKVKLVDAGFVWTEPHSRRLKVKLTIQAEVLNGAILQQTFVVEYVVEPHMCPDCARLAANPNTWTACVQVRQHTEHKRTFFYLEQLILKHGADAQCLSVRPHHQGVDFFFANRSHGAKLVDFLQSVVPIRYRSDKQLVSHNEQNASYNYKYTFSVEIVPICRDDLICLPGKVSGGMGSLGPLVLCTRVTNCLTLTDTSTLRSAQIDAPTFWRAPYRALMGGKQMVEYVVLDIELTGPSNPRYALADAQVAKVADLGANDRTYFCRTHLGHVLHAGDHAWGYDLENANLVDDEMERLTHKGATFPDVILVRKSYEERRHKRRQRGQQQRPWQLRRMAVDEATGEAVSMAAAKEQRRGDDKEAADMERFMQELEEDPELRSKVALYRNPAFDATAASRPAPDPDAMADSDSDSGQSSVPEVPLEELLDDMTQLSLREDTGQYEGQELEGLENIKLT